MPCRNLLGLLDRRRTFLGRLDTELGRTCADPRGCGWFGRATEQSPLALYVNVYVYVYVYVNGYGYGHGSWFMVYGLWFLVYGLMCYG